MENTANSRAKLCNKTFVVLLKIVPRQLLFKQYTCKWLQVFFSCIYQSFTELFHMLLCQWIIQGDAAFGNYRNAFITGQPRRTRHFWCITSMQSEFAPLLHSGRQLRSRGPSPSPSSWKLKSVRTVVFPPRFLMMALIRGAGPRIQCGMSAIQLNFVKKYWKSFKSKTSRD